MRATKNTTCRNSTPKIQHNKIPYFKGIIDENTAVPNGYSLEGTTGLACPQNQEYQNGNAVCIIFI
jgi:hypothetical protein